MLWIHILLGPLMLILAFVFRAFPPQNINEVYGYRTTASMRSQEAWSEANRFSANLLILVAVSTIIIQVITYFTLRPPVSILVSSGWMVLALILSIPITENHLKRHFDDQGRPVNETR